jgi:hypothetical protein
MGQFVRCIVCENTECVSSVGDGGTTRFECPRCGSFALSGSAEATLPPLLDQKPLRRAVMSHVLRRMERPSQGRLRIITNDELETFWRQDRLPTPQAQADNLILWIGDNQPTAIDWVKTTWSIVAATIGLPLSGTDVAAFAWLNTELEPEALFKMDRTGDQKTIFPLTMRGWKRYEELKITNIQSRTAFMAMQFGDAQLNSVVETCFRPAVARAGFELRLLTDHQPAGLIDDQLSEQQFFPLAF